VRYTAWKGPFYPTNFQSKLTDMGIFPSWIECFSRTTSGLLC
jgi:hypothetical protein